MLLASVLLIAGCGDSSHNPEESVEEGIPTKVTFSLSAMSNSSPLSRGDGTPVDPVDDNEKINDWFVVFVDKNNLVREIVSRADAGISITNNAVEQETFSCILPSGTYSVYAFANITPEELTTATGLTFSKNSSVKHEDIQKAVWNTVQYGESNNELTTELNLWSGNIPMSGHLSQIKVRNTIEESFSIEVVRMVAKVEFKFTNPTEDDITIKSISLEPVTQTAVSLFPNGATKDGISYDYLGNRAYTPVVGATYKKLTCEISKTIQKKSTGNCHFYIKESFSNRANDRLFTIWLNLSHGSESPYLDQYNLTKNIKEYINRNDWILIPITLSEYDVRAEAIFYPPIGGYPAFLATNDPDGSQVFTFGTEGEFVITPYVIEKTTGTPLPSDRYKIRSELTVSDPNGIFQKRPALSPTTSTALPDEIIGSIKSIGDGTRTDRATVSFTVDVYDKPYTTSGATVARSYTRTIYIIRAYIP